VNQWMRVAIGSEAEMAKFQKVFAATTGRV
jgi:histidinol-phosphate/aromatic aminotransferase/cobyric acid decarboxylase-like protein